MVTFVCEAINVNQLIASKSWWAILKNGALIIRSYFCQASRVCLHCAPADFSLPWVLAKWKGQTFRMIMHRALQFALLKGMRTWYWGCDLESCNGSKYWRLQGGLFDNNLFICYFLQLKLMQSELNVEEVVNDRSWKVLVIQNSDDDLSQQTVLHWRCGTGALGRRLIRNRWGQCWGKCFRSVIFPVLDAEIKAFQLHCRGKKSVWFRGEESGVPPA